MMSKSGIKNSKILCHLICVFAVCFFMSNFAARADSLWNEKASSPYSREKNFKVGDIVTILVLESTSAIQKAGTNTNIKDDFGTKFNHDVDKIKSVIPLSATAAGNVSNRYTGIGKTERSSYLSAKVSVVVTEVLDNSNLRIAGKHRIEVNDEVQEIKVAGIVRPADVSVSNTVYSYQVADADVTVQGTGVVGDAESPGWLTRFLNWLF